MISHSIAGGATNTEAKVTKFGQLVTTPIEYSDPMFKSMSVVDTANNFFTNKAKKQIVITDVIAFANKDIGPNGATVIIYEATSTTTITISKTILQLDMLKNTSVIITGLNLIVTIGLFVNGKTDDNNVALTIAGYRV